MRTTERTARKPHWCLFCASEIAPGQRYIDGWWLCDGESTPWTAHTDCQALANKYSELSGEGVPPFSEWEPEYDLNDEPKMLAEFARLTNRAAKAREALAKHGERKDSE